MDLYFPSWFETLIILSGKNYFILLLVLLSFDQKKKNINFRIGYISNTSKERSWASKVGLSLQNEEKSIQIILVR